MKYYFFILLFPISLTTISQTHSFSGGTTIVTVLTNDSVVVAADSRRSNMINRNIFDTVYKTGVKNNICYAISGEFISVKDTANKQIYYDSYALIDSLITEYKDIDSSINKFTDITLLFLNDLLGNSPAKIVFQLAPALQNRVIEIQLITYKSDSLIYRFRRIGFTPKPYLPFLSFDANKTDSLVYAWPLISTTPHNPAILYPSIRFMGIYDHAQSDTVIIKANLKNMVSTLKYMVEKEAMYHDTLVGKPIRILVLYKNNSYKFE